MSAARLETQPPEVLALFTLAAPDPAATQVLGELQALVDGGAAHWSIDTRGGVHLVLPHGPAFEVTLAHLTRIR